jgi:glycosyltransferase involved in cell wall biosynthesis
MSPNDQPLVTIGVLAYNRPAMLRNALNCVVRQTYGNLEIIISDDCSPDIEVARVGEEFEAADPRVRFCRQEVNLDAVRNHWFLLAEAKGKYFMWAYDDDLYEATLVERLVERLEANANAILCACDVSIIDDKDQVTRVEKLSSLRGDEAWRRVRRSFFFYPTSNIYLTVLGLFRTAPMHAKGIRPELGCLGFNTSMEVPFLARVSLAGEIISVDEALLLYRSHEDSRYIKELLINMCIRVKLVKCIVLSDISFWERCSLLMAVIDSWLISVPYRLAATLLPTPVKEKIKAWLGLNRRT